MSSPEPSLTKTICGDIPQLTHPNYNQWRDNMVLIISAMRAYAIVTGDDPEPQPLDFDQDDIYDDLRLRKQMPHLWSDFSVPPKYGISSNEWQALSKCGIR